MFELEDTFRKNVKEILEENKSIMGRKKRKGELTGKRKNAPTNMNTLSYNLGFYAEEGYSLQAVCNDINGISRVTLKKTEAYAKALGVGTSRLLYSDELEQTFAALFVISQQARMLGVTGSIVRVLHDNMLSLNGYTPRPMIDMFYANYESIKSNSFKSKLLNKYEHILDRIGEYDSELSMEEIRNCSYELGRRADELYDLKRETISRLAYGYSHLDYAHTLKGTVKMAYFDFGRFSFYLPYYGEDELGIGARQIPSMQDAKMHSNLQDLFSEEDASSILYRFTDERYDYVTLDIDSYNLKDECGRIINPYNEMFYDLKMENYIGY